MMLLLLLFSLLTVPNDGDSASVPASPPGTPVVAAISVDGEISPTTADYIVRGIKKAKTMDAQCLIVQLDTPGGLLKSMKKIVQAFLSSSDMPIVVYVAPAGASAASAGTFVTMAANIAAMAPTTNIGAASPVRMSPGGGIAQPDTVMQKKLFNYAESYIASIAHKRGRNAEWAKSAVHNAKSITADQALKINVIDLIAKNQQVLLNKLDGQTVNGKTLHTKGAVVKEIGMSLTEEFSNFLMNPTMIMILTMIAIFGIVGEVTHPGGFLPGIAGVIALILVLYTSATLPLNVAGFALIGLAVILFISEAFLPTFGVLIAGGIVSFIFGFLMLFQNMPRSMSLSWAWLIPAAVITALFFLLIVSAGLKHQFSTRTTIGKESLAGRYAEVTDTINEQEGRIFLDGEYWNAVSDETIEEGEYCEIVEIQGLTAKVKPLISEKNT